jgi:hypothetical protein
MKGAVGSRTSKEEAMPDQNKTLEDLFLETLKDILRRKEDTRCVAENAKGREF